MMYQLSVILPVYNVEKYLSNCLDSLLSQSFKGRIQVILIEDKSTDDSLNICREYAVKHEHFILLEHVNNAGSAEARNTGLQQVLGQYYVFVDPDDLLPETALEILYNHIDESGADIVKGSNSSFSSSWYKEKTAYSVNHIESYHNDDCLTVLLKHEKLRGHPWGKIFRSEVFCDERFTAGYRMAQDLLYCADLFSKARHVIIIPNIVYKYRVHSGGATGRKYETGAYLSWLKCIEQIQNFVSTKSQISAYQELKIRTLTQLAREARYLRGEVLDIVTVKIDETSNKWLPSFVVLIFKYRISFFSMNRYLKFKRAIHQLKNVNH